MGGGSSKPSPAVKASTSKKAKVSAKKHETTGKKCVAPRPAGSVKTKEKSNAGAQEEKTVPMRKTIEIKEAPTQPELAIIGNMEEHLDEDVGPKTSGEVEHVKNNLTANTSEDQEERQEGQSVANREAEGDEKNDDDDEKEKDEDEDEDEGEEEAAEAAAAEAEEEEDEVGGEAGGIVVSSKSMMEITVEPRANNGSLQIVIFWATTGDCSCEQALTSADTLCLVPSPLGGRWEEQAHKQIAFAQASGKGRGSVVMELAGIVSAEQHYEVHYVLGGEASGDVGQSAPFCFSVEQAPKLTAKNRKEAKAASEKANAASCMQHYAADYKAKTEELNWNPLLTITPEDSTWAKLLREGESKKQTQGLSAEMPAAAGLGEAASNDDHVLDEQQLRTAVMAAFTNTPGFIYAGAGVSMAAPSCSPSWWRLMNDLLEETFSRAPQEFETAVAQLSGGDVSRQPEEIMESYYLVFREHLFTLFQLLDKGEPNANHIGMAKLAKAGKVKAILTTNFDIFIERALAQEQVPYTVVVTSEEFRQYSESGVAGVAVLKIHGTIDRPDTIVAVSNHYKMGKGFGGWKATVTSGLMQACPTLFLGYSGWDFQHKNYQEYWTAQAEVGGQPVFWLTLKAFPGGPDLRRLVGTHIGSRLQIGASSLPEFLVDILSEWDESGMVDVTMVHESGAGATEVVEAARAAFVREWVAALPMVPVLTLLLMEAFVLNKSSQERMKRSKEAGREAEAVGDTTEMSAYFMQLSSEMAAGRLSMEEYQEKIEASTLDLTFVHLQLPKATKDQLKLLVVRTTKDEKCFQEGEDAQLLKAMLPNLVLAAGEGSKYDSSAQEVLDKAVTYLKHKVLPLAGKSDRRSKLMRETYLYSNAALKCPAVREAERVCGMIERFVDDGLAKEWDDERFGSERYKTLQKAVDKVITGYVDTGAVVDVQLKLTLTEAKKGDADALLRDAMSVGLGLVRLVQMRMSEMWDSKRMMEMMQRFHGSEAEQDVPISEFQAIEDELPTTRRLQPLRVAVQKLRKKGVRVGECDNVLAALDFAVSRLWLEVFPHQGNCYTITSAREHKGFYPSSLWPPACQRFAKSRLFRDIDVAQVTDERLLQPLLAAMASVGEATSDVGLMEAACRRSLALTEGKVTELTPAPIPECLAAAYQDRGDYAAASKWYAMALDGLRTSVLRQKADAIVLNACLVQATVDKREALAWALKTSPFFGAAQHFSMVGPGRSLLVQQCERWATELGYASLGEAETKLLSGE